MKDEGFQQFTEHRRGCKPYPAGVVVELSDPCVMRRPWQRRVVLSKSSCEMDLVNKYEVLIHG